MRISDWSSDVCSSDLQLLARQIPVEHRNFVAVAALVGAGNLLIRADVERDAEGIGALGASVPGGAAVGERIDPHELAVGGRLQPLGHGDVEIDAARLA